MGLSRQATTTIAAELGPPAPPIEPTVAKLTRLLTDVKKRAKEREKRERELDDEPIRLPFGYFLRGTNIYGFLHTFDADDILFLRGEMVHAGIPSLQLRTLLK